MASIDIEAQYRAALELTHQMLACAKAQGWEQLTQLGQQRATLVEQITKHTPMLTLHEETRVGALIREIEQESAEIIERVEAWQKDVRILLRMS